MPLIWQNPIAMEPRGYACSYCGHRVGPALGWWATNTNPQARIYLCSYCGSPTFFDIQNRQYPGPPFGNAVASVPQDYIRAKGNEANHEIKIMSFTDAR